MGDERGKEQRFQMMAAWARPAVAGLLMLMFPVLTPQGIGVLLPLFGTYIGLASIIQVCIWKDIGGIWRQVAGGISDIFFLTMLLHLLGSQTSVLTALYIFVCMLHALVTPPKISYFLAILSTFSYSVLVIWEQTGQVSYGSVGFEAGRVVSIRQALGGWMMVGNDCGDEVGGFNAKARTTVGGSE
jgi:hypothetical protein